MILLDTHIWVRWVDSLADPLLPGIVNQIETADAVAISAVSCWETAWLARRGRLQLKLELDRWLERLRGFWCELPACLSTAPSRYLPPICRSTIVIQQTA